MDTVDRVSGSRGQSALASGVISKFPCEDVSGARVRPHIKCYYSARYAALPTCRVVCTLPNEHRMHSCRPRGARARGATELCAVRTPSPSSWGFHHHGRVRLEDAFRRNGRRRCRTTRFLSLERARRGCSALTRSHATLVTLRHGRTHAQPTHPDQTRDGRPDRTRHGGSHARNTQALRGSPALRTTRMIQGDSTSHNLIAGDATHLRPRRATYAPGARRAPPLSVWVSLSGAGGAVRATVMNPQRAERGWLAGLIDSTVASINTDSSAKSSFSSRCGPTRNPQAM
eukprot:5565310-Prymnesium_polylepis.1